MTFLSRKPVLIVGCILFLSISMWAFGNMQLGGFDMSALVDTGWRMASGQTPYVDFPLTTPVAFFVGAGWAIQLFGVKWSSFVIAGIIFTVLSFLAQTYLLNLIIPWKPAIAISFVSQLLCSVVISYWWYNSTTMQAACLFLTAAYVFASKPTEKVSAVALWATLTLLSFMKPNIAGGLAVLVFIPLILFLPQRRRIFLIGIAALASFFLILFLFRISPLDVIQSYLAIGKGRAAPSIRWFFNDKPYEYLVVIPLILLSLLPLLSGVFAKVKHPTSPEMRAYFGITFASLLMGILSLVTNSDSNIVVGVPFFLLSSTIFYYLMEIPSEQTSHRIWRYGGIAFAAFALAGGVITQANYHVEKGTPNMLAFWFIEVIVSGLAAIFLLIIRDDPKSGIVLPQNWARESLVWAALLACGGVAMFAGGMRWRVLYIGYESFFTYSPLTEVNEIPFFRGFQISPTARTTVLEIQDVLQKEYGGQESWKDALIYFGPRIEFSYAAFEISSPRNLPIWWHPNNSYPADRENDYVRSFLDRGFGLAIFMKFPDSDQADFGLLPKPIVENFLSNYRQVDYGSIVVFYKK